MTPRVATHAQPTSFLSPVVWHVSCAHVVALFHLSLSSGGSRDAPALTTSLVAAAHPPRPHAHAHHTHPHAHNTRARPCAGHRAQNGLGFAASQSACDNTTQEQRASGCGSAHRHIAIAATGVSAVSTGDNKTHQSQLFVFRAFGAVRARVCGPCAVGHEREGTPRVLVLVWVFVNNFRSAIVPRRETRSFLCIGY